MDAETALFDLVEHPVFVLKPDSAGVPRYAAFNAFACRGLGRNPDEVIGLTAAELYPGRLGKIAFDHHVNALRIRTVSVYDILLPLGEEQRLVRTTLRPVFDDSGAIRMIVGSSTDISGGQLFREMQTEMETINREMEEFVSLAAHDLRAPMRNVSQVAEMLREDFQDLGDGKLQLIDLLEEVAGKSMKLIADVLSHAQATSVSGETVAFDFAVLAEEVCAILDPLNACDITYGQGMIDGDRTAVQITLRSLIDNSIKHARPSGAAEASRLQMTIRVEDLRNGFFRVSVQDNGAGFNDAALSLLDGGRLRSDSSFGLLGVRRLIKARGGTLEVENCALTPGAVVSFALPGSYRSETAEGSSAA